jgi:hypothetical protein
MKKNGQALIGVLLALVIFMIFIPALVFMVRHEAQWTVMEKKTTSAFHAAESGIDRGMWKLRENSSNWANILGGGTITGYTGTTTYNLYADSDTTRVVGQYKVTIIAGSNTGEILIRSIGRDVSNAEVRGIEAIVSRTTVNSSVSCDGGVTWKPHLTVHWAPVTSYSSIDLTGGGDYFPRKYSTGAINPRDTNINPPNSDGKEYWAFQDLGDPPQIDLASYKALAQKSQIPLSSGGGEIRQATGNNLAISSPTGSGYFRSADNGSKIRLFGSYSFTNSTSAIYVEGGIDFSNSSFLNLNAAIAEGSIDFNANNTVYVASVPASAYLEYVKKKEVTPSYTYPGEGNITYSISNCGMHGFMYSGGTLSGSGGNDAALVGAVKVIGGITMNNFIIYYDAGVAGGVKISNATIRQTSWKEIRATW